MALYKISHRRLEGATAIPPILGGGHGLRAPCEGLRDEGGATLTPDGDEGDERRGVKSRKQARASDAQAMRVRGLGRQAGKVT